jgi:hypothetical protein
MILRLHARPQLVRNSAQHPARLVRSWPRKTFADYSLVEELLDRLTQFADVTVRALQLLVYAVEQVGHAPAALG